MSEPPAQPPPSQPGWPVPQQPPRKPKAPLFLGILIGAVAPFFGLVFPAFLPSSSGLFALAPIVWAFLVLLAGAVLLFSDDTRRWGVGILIGFFGMLIIGAGACVALIFALTSTSGG